MFKVINTSENIVLFFGNILKVMVFSIWNIAPSKHSGDI